jgi:hypothetical protein
VKEFFENMGHLFVLLFQIGVTILIIAALYGMSRWFDKFYYFLEDHTTGFLKVRERLQAATSASLHEMDSAPAEEGYLGYNLEIGKVENNLFEEMMRIPGSMRSTHMYIVGASGTGKSSLLKNLLIQDVQSGMGLCVIDPHGDLINDLIPFTLNRKSETWILDLEDTEHMLSYNPLERRENVLVAEQVGKLILAFKRIWGDSWGARMEDILRHTLALLIEQGYTLGEFERVLTDTDFRNMLLEKSEIDQTKDFFVLRYNNWNPKERIINIESSLNKVSAFLADRRIGARLSQPHSSFDIKQIMDRSGILLVNLGKGRLAGNADLFGALLMADIEMSFLTRMAGNRRPFALYVDEFQNIATESFETVLAEARKFGLCLTMAHQSLKQLDEKLISLILGNAQTQIYFRVSRQDAERLAKESHNIVEKLTTRDEKLMQEPEQKFTLQEMWEIAFHNLSRLEFRKAYVMIKGVLAHPELIRTSDTPFIQQSKFPFTETYRSLDNLEAIYKERKQEIEAKIKTLLEIPVSKTSEIVDVPTDLSFLEGESKEPVGFVVVHNELDIMPHID